MRTPEHVSTYGRRVTAAGALGAEHRGVGWRGPGGGGRGRGGWLKGAPALFARALRRPPAFGSPAAAAAQSWPRLARGSGWAGGRERCLDLHARALPDSGVPDPQRLFARGLAEEAARLLRSPARHACGLELARKLLVALRLLAEREDARRAGRAHRTACVQPHLKVPRPFSPERLRRHALERLREAVHGSPAQRLLDRQALHRAAVAREIVVHAATCEPCDLRAAHPRHLHVARDLRLIVPQRVVPRRHALARLARPRLVIGPLLGALFCLGALLALGLLERGDRGVPHLAEQRKDRVVGHGREAFLTCSSGPPRRKRRPLSALNYSVD